MPIKRRSVLELKLKTRKKYENPFLDVELNCSFMSPSGKEYVMPGFYDGDGIWKVRFSPNEVGTWSYKTSTQASDPDLSSTAQFEVVQPDKSVRGFLKTCPGKYWGLEYEPCITCSV